MPICGKTENNNQKKTFRCKKAASEEVQKERVDYWQEFKHKDPESPIFIDESAIWEGMERAVARSPKDTRDTYKGQKHTLIRVRVW